MIETPITDAEYKRQNAQHELMRECGEHAFSADFEFARTLERELAAMTARAEIAERQVAVLCGRLCVLIDCDIGCPARTDGCVTMCDITTAAWSRAEAVKEGGRG